MKTMLKIGAASVALLMVSITGYAADNSAMPPIPGTVQATDTKTSSAQNNTPRVNPTPNPEPASQPPGAETAHTTVVIMHDR